MTNSALRVKNMVLAVAVTAIFATDLRAETLEVEVNNPLVIDTNMFGGLYSNIVAHSCVVITNGGRFTGNGGVSNLFGTASGDAAGLWIINEGGSSGAPKYTTSTSWANRTIFSGGLVSPAFLVKGYSPDNYPYCIVLDENAVTTADEFNFLQLEDVTARVNFYSLWNRNAKPAVITFKGGLLCLANYWDNDNLRALRVPAAGNKIILRGDASNDIKLRSAADSKTAAWHFPYSSDLGTIATDGDCNLEFNANTSNRGYVNLNKSFDDGQIVWGHTGETRFINHRVTLNADNALPYSTTAIMTNRLSMLDGASPDVACLDLNGYSAKAGCLITENGAYVTNTSATAATLVFGEDNLDSTFSGTICGDVTLVKKGTGTLTIADGSVVPKIKLDGAELSSVVIDGSATIGEWDVSIAPKKEGETTYAIASGETYDVAPFGIEPAWFWDVSWTNLYRFNYKNNGTPRSSMQDVLEATTSNGLHRVSVESGGTAAIDVAEGATEKYEYLALTGSGTLEKTGSGTATILGDNRVALGTLHVAGGTLKFQGRGCTNEWWRVVMKKNGKDTILATGRIGIFDANGDMAVSGLDWKEYNKDISTLALREWTDVLVTNGVTSVEDPWKYANSYDRKYLFDIDKDNRGKMGLQYSKTSKTDEATITFRANLTESPAIWHSLSTAGSKGYCPYQWSLETSPDGETWNAINEISSEDWIFSSSTWRNDGRYSDKSEGMPWRIGLDNAPAAVSALGTVQVDSGATLDLSMTTNAVISSIAIDVQSAGGTISGGSLASAGAVSVVSTSDKLPKTVLLTFDGTANATALRNWTVTFNGSVVPRRLVCDSETGEVHFSPSGFILMVK